MSNEVQTLEFTRQPTAMTLLEMAVSNNAAIDTIERLAALQEHMMENQAKQEFNAAMTRCQAAMSAIGADAVNPQTKSKYATYVALDRALRPIYSREGFALSFDTADSPVLDTIKVLCNVSHQAGHVRVYQVTMPADGKGAKGGDVMTKTHATGAAMSYGMRYLLKMIFNVAVGETDNDGNGIDQDEIERNSQYIHSARTLDELTKNFGEVYGPAYNAKPQKTAACRAYLEAKNARQKELK